VWQWR